MTIPTGTRSQCTRLSRDHTYRYNTDVGLRGSALSLGFASFSRLCLEVEQKAGRGLATDEEISEVLFAFFNSKADFIDGLPAALAA